jgi:enoyl-CoA hydratase
MIRYDLQDHIVTITIDRYEKRNAIDPDHALALIDAWERFRDDPEAWVAVVTGVKDVFCSGADLNFLEIIAKEMAETGRSATDDRMTKGGTASWTLKGTDIFKPLIVAVNGACIAGGMEVLGGSDIRIASTSAYFWISEPRRGAIAGGGTTALLPRQLNWPAAMEMLLVADKISAERALQLGLLNEVVAPDELLPAAYRWAQKICQNSPSAVQLTKKSAVLGLRAGTLAEANRIERECLEAVLRTEDGQEGPRAFLEKRPPVWKGR